MIDCIMPHEWQNSELELLLTHVIGGDWGQAEDFIDPDYVGVYCIRGAEFKNWKRDKGSSASVRKIKISSLQTRKLEIGDILIEISGGGPDQPVGRTVLIDERTLFQLSGKPIVCTNFLRLARSSHWINSTFLNYYLNHFYLSGEVKNYQGGSNNLRNLKFKEFSQIAIPIPPLAEQQQIAAKLDDLLAQVGTLKTRLDAIPKILKRFRQSVLAAAVSGRLTEDWRANMSYIQSEFGWHIPKSWQLLVIDDIAEVKGGKRLPKGESLVSENTGYPYIRAGQLKDGTVMEEDQLFLLIHVQAKISRYIVNTGDLYITIVGACIGDAGIIPPNYDGANLTENAAKLCLFKKPLNEQYLSNWLRSQYLQDIIQNEIKSGAQGKLALKRIKTLPVPYPPIEEQSEIVRRVEQFFTYADQIEQRVKDAQSRVNHLTQAILAKAFRGELTAEWRDQNPDLIRGENSAEALLAKIRTERTHVAATKQADRKINV